MDLSAVLQSAALVMVMLNPFLVILYLLDLVRKMTTRMFAVVMAKAGLIAAMVYCTFGILGDAVFSRFLQVDFASFQIFGGVVFLLIGLQFVFKGPDALDLLRGDSENLAGKVAMPVLVGPGTISVCVVVGERHPPLISSLLLSASIFVSVLVMILLKWVHDKVRPRREALIERYIEIAGRISALVIGTISVQMIMQGVITWARKL